MCLSCVKRKTCKSLFEPECDGNKERSNSPAGKRMCTYLCVCVSKRSSYGDGMFEAGSF